MPVKNRSVRRSSIPRIAWAVLLSLGATTAAVDTAATPITAHYSSQDNQVVIGGLSADQLADLGKMSPDKLQRQVTLHLHRDAVTPAMLGKASVANETLKFQPRFELRPGRTYDIVIRAHGRVLRHQITIATTKTPPTTVRAVYPSADRLPENLLKIYVHFSGEMRRGDIYRHIKLLDEGNREVELPFLEIDQELWSRDGLRLTLLLDPGRIKQGLLPRKVAGPVLQSKQSYTLAIDKQWRDAAGKPLQRGFRKSFRVTAADAVQPDVKNWKITPPTIGTREPLRIEFGEPLDHALIERFIAIRAPENGRLVGKVSHSKLETVWEFAPRQVWAGEKYQIVVDRRLEDLAGNSIGRPFESDPNADLGPVEGHVILAFQPQPASKL